MIVAAKRGRSLDHGVRFEHAALAKLNLVADDGERPDSNAAADSRRWRNDGPAINFAHRAFTGGHRGGRHFRFQIHHFAHQRGFRRQFSVHGRAAVKFAERPSAPGHNVHFEPQLIAGNHGRRKRALSMETK
jgi:hypothetical protein